MMIDDLLNCTYASDAQSQLHGFAIRDSVSNVLEPATTP